MDRKTELESALNSIESRLKKELKYSYLSDAVAKNEVRTETGVTTEGEKVDFENQFFWDDERLKTIRIMITGSYKNSLLSSIFPQNTSFIVAPDGMFVGE